MKLAATFTCQSCAAKFTNPEDALAHNCMPTDPLTQREQLLGLIAALGEKVKKGEREEFLEAEIGRFVLQHPSIIGPMVETDVRQLAMTGRAAIAWCPWPDVTLKLLAMPTEVQIEPKHMRAILEHRRALADYDAAIAAAVNK